MTEAKRVKLLTECETPEAAIRVAKSMWDGHCAISGVMGATDGAHIYSRSLYPQIKSFPACVLPMNHSHHTRIDAILKAENGKKVLIVSNPEDRILYALKHVDIEMRPMLKWHLGCLKELCDLFNGQWWPPHISDLL